MFGKTQQSSRFRSILNLDLHLDLNLICVFTEYFNKVDGCAGQPRRHSLMIYRPVVCMRAHTSARTEREGTMHHIESVAEIQFIVSWGGGGGRRRSGWV